MIKTNKKMAGLYNYFECLRPESNLIPITNIIKYQLFADIL